MLGPSRLELGKQYFESGLYAPWRGAYCYALIFLEKCLLRSTLLSSVTIELNSHFPVLQNLTHMMMKITSTMVARVYDFKMGRAGKMNLNVYITLLPPVLRVTCLPKDLITEDLVVGVQCTLQVEAASNRGD